MTASKEALTREILALEGSYRRLDNGLNTGRNANASDDTRDWHWATLKQLLEDGGYEVLDANRVLASRFNRLERRRAGLVNFRRRHIPR
jgi:hypothetical protein